MNAPSQHRPRSLLSSALDALETRLRSGAPEDDGLRGDLRLASHLVARALRDRRDGLALRRTAVDLAATLATRAVFGKSAMVSRDGAFHPIGFLPDLHGAHFHRALANLAVPHRGPFVVHLALTGACPWSCAYCFSSSGGAGAPDVGDLALDRVARSLADKRVPIVILGGGEPLARFERALRTVATLSRGCEVRLATSGSGFTLARAKALRAAGMRVVAISLDSDDRARVDGTRGDGAFDTAVRALSVAAEAEVFTLVTAVVGRHTFASEAAVDRYLRCVRARHPRATVNFIPAFSTGRGSGEGFRTPDEYRATGAMLSRAVREGAHRAGVFYASPMDALVGCVGSAHRQLFVDTRGNLCACVSGGSFGNLVSEPFDAVWGRMLSAPSAFKRGYLCAHVAERVEAPAVLGHEDTLEALRGFLDEAPDALMQRAIDCAGPLFSWCFAAVDGGS